MERYLKGEVGKYAIRCPFHDDRHASGQVYPQGSFHCFVCERHASSLIDFVRQLHYGDEPYGRGMALARAIVERNVGRVTTAPPEERKEVSAGVIEAMTIFGRLAMEQLAKESDLLNGIRISRGIENPLAFGIGVTSGSLVTQTGQALLTMGCTPKENTEILQEAGITDGNTYRLGRRLFIPEIRNGKVVFYQARAIGMSKYKYLNPPLPKPIYGYESL